MAMMAAKNRKLCWNCEGSVHVRATKCPYCGAELTAEAPQQQLSVEEIPRPPYAQHFEQPEVQEETAAQEQSEELREAMVLPMLLLLPGAFFFLFGAILLLFSKDGFLTLQWNAHFWFLYVALSLPLFYFGWRSLRR